MNRLPSFFPSFLPSLLPSFFPSFLPSLLHSFTPSFLPSFLPSLFPSFLSFLLVFPSFLPSIHSLGADSSHVQFRTCFKESHIKCVYFRIFGVLISHLRLVICHSCIMKIYVQPPHPQRIHRLALNKPVGQGNPWCNIPWKQVDKLLP